MAGKKKRAQSGKGGGAFGGIVRMVSLAFAAILVLAVGVVIGARLAPPREEPPRTATLESPPRPQPPTPVPEPQPEPEPEADSEPAPVVVPEPTVGPPPALVTDPPARPDLPPAGQGNWLKYAVTAPETAGKPVIAIVIDDLGIDRRRSDRILSLPGPLTAAFMSYAKDLPRQAAAARAKGHELLLHMPMEPQDASYDPGPDVLVVGQSAEEVRRRVGHGLDAFEGMIGLNNHMGSRFTAHAAGMQVVMEELRRRGLVFLDSLTTGKSVGPGMARRYGVPAAVRDVFLDNKETVPAVLAQLARTEQVAKKHGNAIAIGHPHDATAEALAQWLPTLAAKGFVLVPVSAIIKKRNPTG